MGRGPANFRQEDLSRAIKAAKDNGLEILKVEVDPRTSRITITTKAEASTSEDNPFDEAPVSDPAIRKRKSKAPC